MTTNEKQLKRDYSTERRVLWRFVPESTRTLLDIGCYTGSFGAGLKALRSMEVWGIEPDRDAAAIAGQRLDRVIMRPFDSDCDLPHKYFDVITFNDSLEHFANPQPAVELCKRLLAPNGRIVCTMPNMRHIDNLEHLILDADWRYEDAGVRDKTHLRFFTKKSMKRLFEECGYDVIEQTGINAEWWAKRRMARRVLFRLFPRQTEDMKFVQIVNVVVLRDVTS